MKLIQIACLGILLLISSPAFAMKLVQIEDKMVRFDQENSKIQVQALSDFYGSHGETTEGPTVKDGIYIGSVTRADVFVGKDTPLWMLKFIMKDFAVWDKLLYEGPISAEGLNVGGTLITLELLDAANEIK